MLIAPAAPAATAMHSTAANANTRFMWTGATIRPIAPGEYDEADDAGLE